MPDRAKWIVTLVAALLGSACSSDLGHWPMAEVVDSAGLRVIKYDLSSIEVPTYAELGEPDLELGSLDGATESLFSRVIDLRTTDDGSIVVSDRGAAELRIFDRQGRHLGTLGQFGEGPGEFATAPMIAGLAGDTVFAWDGSRRRITSFLRGGTAVGTTTLQAESVGPIQVIRQDDGTYLSQSRWVSPQAENPRPHDIQLALDSVLIEHVDASGAHLETVVVLADMEQVSVSQVLDDGRLATQMMPRPLSARAFLRSDGLRPIIAHNGSFEIVWYGKGGAAEAVLRVEGAWPTVTPREIRAKLEAQLVEASENGEIDPRVLRVYEEFMPERIPGFSDMIISSDQDIWVSSYEFDRSTGFDWLVFSSAGEFRGRVSTPPGLRVFDIGEGYLTGVVLDELDVPYVRRHPFALVSGN